MERPLYRFAARPASIRRNAPRFAEHNGRVFGEILGLSPDQIAELERDGVTASEPNMAAHR
jgi:crotonobetainyl-CoA:carnitine CoA-transferase CaiB-like acyl-CoA transferase